MSPKLHLMLVQGILIVGSIYFLVGLGLDLVFEGHLPTGGWLSRIVGAVLFGAIMGWYTWRVNQKKSA
jgi:hypothetical protein